MRKAGLWAFSALLLCACAQGIDGSTDYGTDGGATQGDSSMLGADAPTGDAITSDAVQSAGDAAGLDVATNDVATGDASTSDATGADAPAADVVTMDVTGVDAPPEVGGQDSSMPDTGGSTCPTALMVGDFSSGAAGWTFGGLWKASGGYMVAGSTTKYSSSYTQDLTSPSDVDLAACASATLSFQVEMDDDPSYTPCGSDMSERLYVQCSGNSGSTWNNLTPSPWPSSESGCNTSYCSGDCNASRAFSLTGQTVTLPAACLTATARFRFEAKGSDVWNMLNPGWYVGSVKVN